MCIVYVIFPVLSLAVLFYSFYLPAWFSKEREREGKHRVGSVCVWWGCWKLGSSWGELLDGKLWSKYTILKNVQSKEFSNFIEETMVFQWKQETTPDCNYVSYKQNPASKANIYGINSRPEYPVLRTVNAQLVKWWEWKLPRLGDAIVWRRGGPVGTLARWTIKSNDKHNKAKRIPFYYIFVQWSISVAFYCGEHTLNSCLPVSSVDV